MIRYAVDYHNSNCTSFWREQCVCRRYPTEDYYFYFGGQIHKVTAPVCNIDAPHDLIWRVLKEKGAKGLRMYKGYPPWKYCTTPNFCHEFREFRLRGKPLRKWVYQQNYVLREPPYYRENWRFRRHEYTIVSKITLAEAFSHSEMRRREEDELDNIVCMSEIQKRELELYLLQDPCIFLSEKDNRIMIDYLRKEITKTAST